MENNERINELFEEMLEETAKQCAREQSEKEDNISTEEKEKAQKSAKEMLQGFLSYLRSIRFSNKISEMSKKFKLPKNIVRNTFIKSILTKIADVLQLGIAITAEIIKYAVEFIGAVIVRVVDFTYNTCIALTNAITFNCGSMA